jgi:hypothetical protein
MKSELARIKEKLNFNPDSFQSALTRHRARQVVALYKNCMNAPDFDPRRYVLAVELLEDDTPVRWRKDQEIIMKYYAKHPPSPDEPPHPEWGLTPEEMRENHVRYYWGEELDCALVKVLENFNADYPDHPPLEGEAVKHGPKWVKVHWTPEMDIEYQEMDDLISELEQLEGMDPSEESENPEVSWLLRRGRHLLESLGGPKLEDVIAELHGERNGPGGQENQSPSTDT